MKAVSDNLKGLLQVTVMLGLVVTNQFQGLNGNILHCLIIFGVYMIILGGCSSMLKGSV
ncbi:hypothetical protein C5167_035703 [Papaver somniferum]|nr:hypothetical protein C5167_035703 [Papaver somniferum]